MPRYRLVVEGCCRGLGRAETIRCGVQGGGDPLPHTNTWEGRPMVFPSRGMQAPSQALPRVAQKYLRMRMPGAPTLTTDAQTWASSPTEAWVLWDHPAPLQGPVMVCQLQWLWAPLLPSMPPLWPGPGRVGRVRPWAPASLVPSRGGTGWPPRHWDWGPK